MDVRIGNSEDPDQTASSGLSNLSWQAIVLKFLEHLRYYSIVKRYQNESNMCFFIPY